MNVLVTGLGGFIGQHVKSVFEGEGHRIYTVPREVSLPGGKTLQEATEGADVIVNLAGENLMDSWTNEKMIEIVESPPGNYPESGKSRQCLGEEAFFVD